MILFHLPPDQPGLRHLQEPPEPQEKQMQGPEQGWDSPMQQDRLGAGSICRKGLEDPGGQQLEQESAVSMEGKSSAASWGCTSKIGKSRGVISPLCSALVSPWGGSHVQSGALQDRQGTDTESSGEQGLLWVGPGGERPADDPGAQMNSIIVL